MPGDATDADDEFRLPMPFVSYAQNAEDVVLWRAFRTEPTGFYVDVGAAHADEDSVTRAFHDRGWRGINIEAVPAMAAAIARARPHDVTLAVAAGAAAGTIALHLVEATGLSTTDPATARALSGSGFAAEVVHVPVRPLRDILHEHAPDDIHFLKIDVEGAEHAVLEGCDFTLHRPRVVLLEATRPLSTEPGHAEWEPLLLAAGYRFALFDGLNRFYVADEWWHVLGDLLATPANTFDDYVRVADAVWARRATEQAQQAVHATSRARLAEASAREAYARAFEQARTSGTDRIRREVADRSANAAVERAAAWERRALEAEARLAAAAPAAASDANQAAELRALLDATYRSTSWRLTRPIRAAGAAIRARRPPADPVFPAPAPAPPPAPPLAPAPTPAQAAPASAPASPRTRLRSVHQFHSGSATGDAVTNSLLLIQDRLRRDGYRSEIFVQHRDPALRHALRTLEELPQHPDQLLIVHHSMGHDALDLVLASPARKVLYYHNITPEHLLPDDAGIRHYARLGHAQLEQLRPVAEAALAPSDYNALELRRLGFRGVRTVPLLFDVDAMRARLPPRPPRDRQRPFTVLFVGRVIESKGQADLVDAFAGFLARFGRPARLVLVGRTDSPGDYADQVGQRISAHGIGAHVMVTGPVSDQELDQQYLAADLYVSLSRHEGFGVPLVEAMVRGIPVLAWPCGAVPYVLGNAGALPDRTPAAVAARMLDLAADPARHQALTAAQSRVLDRHRLDRHWPAMLDALAAAGAEPPPDPATSAALAANLRFAVTGHAQGSYSLASVNRATAAAIEAERPGRVRLLPVETVPTTDLSVLPPATRALAERGPPPTGPEIVLSQHYPIHLPPVRGDLALAMVFWEESLLPADMVAALGGFDGVLAPTRTVAKALIDSGLRRPVRVVGQAPDLAAFEEVARHRGRDRSSRDGAPFTFLHVSSCFPRKGVDLLLAAYASAFRPDDPVRLVIKTFPNPHNTTADQIAGFQAAGPGLPPVQLIEAELDTPSMLALYRDAGAMVLPTRGEGFNLPAAEAMAAGVPLIVTGFGGHMDFCGPDTARLLAYRMAPACTHLSSPGSLWAEADHADLVAAMREAAGVDTEGRAARARIAIRRHASRPGYVRAIEDAALTFLLQPPAAPLRIAWVTSWGVRCGVAEYSRLLLDALPPDPAIAGHVILADDRLTPGPLPDLARVRPAWHAGDDTGTERLKSALAAEDADIVVIQHQAGLIGWAGLIALLTAPELRDRIVVVTLHHTRDLPTLDSGLRQDLVAALGRAARIVVHTLADLDRLHAYGLAGTAVQVPHGARPKPAAIAAPEPRPHAPLVGCYGFLLPTKGVAELVSALPLLRRTHPGARLRLVNAEYDHPSSRDEIERCRSLASELGLADAIEWHTDFLPDAESMRLLGECDVIAVPTQSSLEASSASVRSALAAGPPVLVTPLPLFDDVGDAVLRSAGTGPQDLAAALDAILRDPAAAAAAQARAAAWMQLHAWPVVAARFQDMLLALAASGLRASDEGPNLR